MRTAKKRRNQRLIKFPQIKDRRIVPGRSPLADPHPEWPIHVSETNAYHNEPRNPYQSEDEDSAQAFVQKYLELADIAMALEPESHKDDEEVEAA